MIRIDYYLTQVQKGIQCILIIVQSIIMYRLDLAGGCVSNWTFQLSIILKIIEIIAQEIEQLHFDAIMAKFRLGVEAYLEKLDTIKQLRILRAAKLEALMVFKKTQNEISDCEAKQGTLVAKMDLLESTSDEYKTL